jgi:hypothetical protein
MKTQDTAARKPSIAETITQAVIDLPAQESYVKAYTLADTQFKTKQRRPNGSQVVAFSDGSNLVFDAASFWPTF